MLYIGYNFSVISIKKYPLENTENASAELCGFIQFPFLSVIFLKIHHPEIISQ